MENPVKQIKEPVVLLGWGGLRINAKLGFLGVWTVLGGTRPILRILRILEGLR